MNQDPACIFYWLVVALLGLFIFYTSVDESRLRLGLLVPPALGLLGLRWFGIRYFGTRLTVFGAYPVLPITRSQFRSSAWTGVVRKWHSMASPTPAGIFGCTVVSADLILFRDLHAVGGALGLSCRAVRLDPGTLEGGRSPLASLPWRPMATQVSGGKPAPAAREAGAPVLQDACDGY